MSDADNTVVLVADGDVSVLEDISSTLEKAGFTVLTARSSSAVMELCSHHPQPIHLAIVSMAMSAGRPDMVEQLERSYLGIRYLFTASNDESASVAQLGCSGAVREFLLKPFRRSQLLGRALQVLDAPMVRTA